MPFVCLTALMIGPGCNTVAPVTHRTAAQVGERTPPPHQTYIAPLDVEIAELTASGAAEPHADWTAQAERDLLAALQNHTGFRPYDAADLQRPEVQAELQDVGVLVHLMSLNQLAGRVPNAIGPVPPSAATHAFDYETGRLSAHSDYLGDGAVLFIHLRESYATGGRKALAALGLVSAAFTGVYVMPTMGSTLATAALVDDEGHVLWINQVTVAPDLRTPEGIAQLVSDLLRGLPAPIPAPVES
ncbi:hypothetical protein [Actomonas aquatica]|uniref:Lipoprotein n=1 Tax=Actomonas aquatica TaxID=2866162 RepID=A0ABZ1C6M3_9BACT|nr:hypothetical protein [Opitutus sp. WL0086]WRQ87062.1 hypothetical protein K1X11_019785 [Opitutus sp. WL0086]